MISPNLECSLKKAHNFEKVGIFCDSETWSWRPGSHSFEVKSLGDQDLILLVQVTKLA